LTTNAKRFKDDFTSIKEDYVLPHNNTALHILKKMSELEQLREQINEPQRETEDSVKISLPGGARQTFTQQQR